MDPVPTSNWVFENQPIAGEILTQSSRNKRAESNLLADEKGPQHWIQVIVWVIHLFLYIFYLDIFILDDILHWQSILIKDLNQFC